MKKSLLFLSLFIPVTLSACSNDKDLKRAEDERNALGAEKTKVEQENRGLKIALENVTATETHLWVLRDFDVGYGRAVEVCRFIGFELPTSEALAEFSQAPGTDAARTYRPEFLARVHLRDNSRKLEKGYALCARAIEK